MKKTTTKIICLVLAIVMVAPTFVFAGKPINENGVFIMQKGSGL